MSRDHPPRQKPLSEPGAPPATAGAAAQAVRDVLEEQQRRRARQEAARGKKPRKRLLPLPVVALLWGVACLVVWVATPTFLLPDPLPEPSPARMEAGLRLEMVVLASEINQFREETGRVPESLQRISTYPPSDIRYVPMPPSSYRLSGNRGGVEIVYHSEEPVEALRAEARQVIRGDAGGSS